MGPYLRLILVAFTLNLGACSSLTMQPIKTVEHVDIKRFMGDWYVIANIPTFIEKGAHNAVESYHLAEDGTIETVFTFRKDAFDGKVKRYEPTGYILDTDSNAVWGMRFVWPFKAEYRIIYLGKDYNLTVIGRSKRDYAWIMARSPEIDDTDFRRMLELLSDRGYDTSLIQKVPQQWH